MLDNRFGLLAGLLIIIGILGYVWFGNNQPEWTKWHSASEDGASKVWIGTPLTAPRSALNILFVGNGYTSCQDMPQLLTEIATHDPQGNAELRVQSVTQAEGDLQGLWNTGRAAQIIRGARWTYVVLQEESFGATSQAGMERSTNYTTKFDQLIREAGGRSVLFMTWPRKLGDWHTGTEYAYIQSAQSTQNLFMNHTYNLATQLGAPIADVGSYWTLALQHDKDLSLYTSDNRPGPAGEYLTALVFYSLFTGRDPQQLTWAPSDVPEPTAAELRHIAAIKLSVH